MTASFILWLLLLLGYFSMGWLNIENSWFLKSMPRKCCMIMLYWWAEKRLFILKAVIFFWWFDSLSSFLFWKCTTWKQNTYFHKVGAKTVKTFNIYCNQNSLIFYSPWVPLFYCWKSQSYYFKSWSQFRLYELLKNLPNGKNGMKFKYIILGEFIIPYNLTWVSHCISITLNSLL